MPDHTTQNLRENYDRLAGEYAHRIFDELRHKPLDRQLLDRFAAYTRGQGEVCDLGCGPGHIARYLDDAQVPVFGVDLSPAMVQQARRRNPNIPFREGDMLSLDIPTGALAGIAAFYAIVNLPRPSLDIAFDEMTRVLRPGGRLLLAFHAGDGVISLDELWGLPITLDFFLFQPSQICRHLEVAGLVVDEITEREPYPEVEYQSRRAYIFAHKPWTEQPSSTLHG